MKWMRLRNFVMPILLFVTVLYLTLVAPVLYVKAGDLVATNISDFLGVDKNMVVIFGMFFIGLFFTALLWRDELLHSRQKKLLSKG